MRRFDRISVLLRAVVLVTAVWVTGSVAMAQAPGSAAPATTTDRLAALDRLKRKYGAGTGEGLGEVIKFGEEAARRLAEVENRDALLAELQRLGGVVTTGQSRQEITPGCWRVRRWFC